MTLAAGGCLGRAPRWRVSGTECNEHVGSMRCTVVCARRDTLRRGVYVCADRGAASARPGARLGRTRHVASRRVCVC